MSRTAILGTWTDLVSRLDANGTPARWAAAQPALANLHTIDELPAWRRSGNPARDDAVIGALVHLAATAGHDDPDAVLVLLHLLDGGAARITQRFANLCGTDTDGMVLGELTVQIRKYPLHRRTRAYAANLLMDTQAALWREIRPYRETKAGRVWILAADPTNLHNDLSDIPTEEDEDGLELLDVLMWAERTGVVNADDVALLLALADPAHADSDERPEKTLATHRGVSIRTVERHRARAVTALRHASEAYLAA